MTFCVLLPQVYSKDHNYCHFQQNYDLNMVQYLLQICTEKISKFTDSTVHMYLNFLIPHGVGGGFVEMDLFCTDTSIIAHPF